MPAAAHPGLLPPILCEERLQLTIPVCPLCPHLPAAIHRVCEVPPQWPPQGVRTKGRADLPIEHPFPSFPLPGKMFKSLDLSLIVEFILMFYRDKPIDWLLDHILWVKVCNPEKDAVSRAAQEQVGGLAGCSLQQGPCQHPHAWHKEKCCPGRQC